jgi:hypothetical protein
MDHYAALFAQILSDQMTLNLQMGEVATAQAIARELIKVAVETHADRQLRHALELLGEAGSLGGAGSGRPKVGRRAGAGSHYRPSLNRCVEPAL